MTGGQGRTTPLPSATYPFHNPLSKHRHTQTMYLDSRKSVTWSAVPDASLSEYVLLRWWEGSMTYNSTLDIYSFYREELIRGLWDLWQEASMGQRGVNKAWELRWLICAWPTDQRTFNSPILVHQWPMWWSRNQSLALFDRHTWSSVRWQFTTRENPAADSSSYVNSSS